MQVRDVMTHNVISIGVDQPILKAIRLMLHNDISGLPVVDANGNLIGMVTEGDFLRRDELGTQRRRPRWLEFLLGPGRMADEFVHTAGRNIGEVMTHDPLFVSENDPLETVVELMERHHIKRLPVLRGGKMTGIVSRANLMHALVRLALAAEVPSGSDVDIRERVLAAFAKQVWAPGVRVAVKDGVVELEGTITDDRQRQACIVVAENVPGIEKVHDHIVWVEPMSGMAFGSPEDEEKTAGPISPITAVA
jgi:CBS domain-containing protein